MTREKYCVKFCLRIRTYPLRIIIYTLYAILLVYNVLLKRTENNSASWLTGPEVFYIRLESV